MAFASVFKKSLRIGIGRPFGTPLGLGSALIAELSLLA